MNNYKHYVYKITNKINGKIYVGKRSCDCEISEDKYMGSGVALKQSFKKYGIGNFSKEVLQECSTSEEAYTIEKEIVTVEFSRLSSNYNMVAGGEGWHKGYRHSRESRHLMSKIAKDKGQVPSKRAREAALTANTGSKHSEEHRRKISEGNTGRKFSEDTKKKISESNSPYVYITPYGNFRTAALAAVALGCRKGTIEGRCIRSDSPIKMITQKHIVMLDSMKVTKDQVGMTYRQLGWYVEISS